MGIRVTFNWNDLVARVPCTLSHPTVGRILHIQLLTLQKIVLFRFVQKNCEISAATKILFWFRYAEFCRFYLSFFFCLFCFHVIYLFIKCWRRKLAYTLVLRETPLRLKSFCQLTFVSFHKRKNGHFLKSNLQQAKTDTKKGKQEKNAHTTQTQNVNRKFRSCCRLRKPQNLLTFTVTENFVQCMYVTWAWKFPFGAAYYVTRFFPCTSESHWRNAKTRKSRLFKNRPWNTVKKIRPVHKRDEWIWRINEFVDELNQGTVPFGAVHTEFVHELNFIPSFFKFFCGQIHTIWIVCSIPPVWIRLKTGNTSNVSTHCVTHPCVIWMSFPTILPLTLTKESALYAHTRTLRLVWLSMVSSAFGRCVALASFCRSDTARHLASSKRTCTHWALLRPEATQRQKWQYKKKCLGLRFRSTTVTALTLMWIESLERNQQENLNWGTNLSQIRGHSIWTPWLKIFTHLLGRWMLISDFQKKRKKTWERDM